MADAPITTLDLPPPVSGWLQPLEGTPCGSDLSQDPDFFEMERVGQGKQPTQFDPNGVPPDWLATRELCESLFGRTRDLRVAMWWGRAMLNLEGFVALPTTLALLRGLVDRFWDHVYPLPDPDDGDTFARLAVIGGFDKVEGVLGDVRQSMLSTDERMGGLRVRDIEVATQRLPPRKGEAPRSQAQIAGTLSELPEIAAAVARSTKASLQNLVLLQKLIAERFSADMGVDLKVLRSMLAAVQSVLPGEPPVGSPSGDGAEPGLEPGTERGGGPERPVRLSGVHSVDSRHDAIRAIEMVCAYLERSEPTNPAQLLLRRAARVIDKDFLQLVRDLAPDAIKEVARIMGVDPSSVKEKN